MNLNKNRIVFLLGAIILNILLIIIGLSIEIAGVITFISIMGVYMLVGNSRHKKRYKILQENCDPEKFLKYTNAQYKITGSQKVSGTILNLEIAMGLNKLGEFSQSIKHLEKLKTEGNIQKNKIFNGMFIFIYIDNLYKLGEIEKAKFRYETEVVTCDWTLKKLQKTWQHLQAQHLYYEKDYVKSRELLENLLQISKKSITKFEFLYELAKIDEKENHLDEAVNKYNHIAKNGNKLWIAAQAKQILFKYENIGEKK